MPVSPQFRLPYFTSSAGEEFCLIYIWVISSIFHSLLKNQFLDYLMTHVWVTVFWDMTLCSLAEVNRYSGGMYCLYLQSRRVRQANKPDVSRNQNHTASCLLLACLHGLSLTLKMETAHFSENRLTYAKSHCITFKKTVLYSHCCESLNSNTLNVNFWCCTLSIH
jgi:hypothetical protein